MTISIKPSQDHPDVSIVMPCRNEEAHIAQCIQSVLDQDYPADNYELLIVDGMSDDQTRKIVHDNFGNTENIRVIDNPARTTPHALNAGIKNARGQIIMIMGAHAHYASDYVSKCVKSLLSTDADNVGGICRVLCDDKNLLHRSIAAALSSPFGVGNSYFRIGTAERRYVDTVFGGCYRKEIFEKIGLFDTDLLRGQDTEFNARLRKNGGKILLDPQIVSAYVARDTLKKLVKMEWQYGYFKPLVIKKVGGLFTLRQTVPPAFVLTLGILLVTSFFSLLSFYILLSLLLLYLSVNIPASTSIALRKGIGQILFLPVIFAIIHFCWGTGFLAGTIDFILLSKESKEGLTDISLTR
ncbi:Poly-beta-1,6-N-acetyl-D-glucosamine synthase [Anaerohalosphaera lusitana]|uniref:Poly-beta-1,6-N-acetyl-D-glucosamine synthase n=1 Tax=Anaerohalosphaera lusitana TaxID=1936003 RepID=A0A1U9NPS4_9BACT|nr:glycosyltransferase family 2 protein [Anaerohalosphaera lusitana]AQT69610.1 Poly-beta-1,6-N-acetyl-D-glucosamine synthase [Anaerohalosphaera lusitana]